MNLETITDLRWLMEAAAYARKYPYRLAMYGDGAVVVCDIVRSDGSRLMRLPDGLVYSEGAFIVAALNALPELLATAERALAEASGQPVSDDQLTEAFYRLEQLVRGAMSGPENVKRALQHIERIRAEMAVLQDTTAPAPETSVTDMTTEEGFVFSKYEPLGEASPPKESLEAEQQALFNEMDARIRDLERQLELSAGVVESASRQYGCSALRSTAGRMRAALKRKTEGASETEPPLRYMDAGERAVMTKALFSSSSRLTKDIPIVQHWAGMSAEVISIPADTVSFVVSAPLPEDSTLHVMGWVIHPDGRIERGSDAAPPDEAAEAFLTSLHAVAPRLIERFVQAHGAGEAVGWTEDPGLKHAPKNYPIQVHRDGWSKPRCANWSSGTWWMNGVPYTEELHRWAPMLPVPSTSKEPQ